MAILLIKIQSRQEQRCGPVSFSEVNRPMGVSSVRELIGSVVKVRIPPHDVIHEAKRAGNDERFDCNLFCRQMSKMIRTIR